MGSSSTHLGLYYYLIQCSIAQPHKPFFDFEDINELNRTMKASTYTWTVQIPYHASCSLVQFTYLFRASLVVSNLKRTHDVQASTIQKFRWYMVMTASLSKPWSIIAKIACDFPYYWKHFISDISDFQRHIVKSLCTSLLFCAEGRLVWTMETLLNLNCSIYNQPFPFFVEWCQVSSVKIPYHKRITIYFIIGKYRGTYNCWVLHQRNLIKHQDADNFQFSQ